MHAVYIPNKSCMESNSLLMLILSVHRQQQPNLAHAHTVRTTGAALCWQSHKEQPQYQILAVPHWSYLCPQVPIEMAF
jgi:hypothetical protein